MSSEAAPAYPQTATSVPSEMVRIFLRDGTRTNMDSRKIVAHDFSSRGAISQADLRNIETLCQRYVRSLAARLSIFLRMECTLKPGTVGSLSFAKFSESAAAASCVTLFGIEQLGGVGILDVRLPLALAMADRLLGGKGRAPAEERALTEIEMALLGDVMQIFLAGWADLWAFDGQALHAQIIGHETSGRGLKSAAADAVFVVLTVEMTVGEVTGQFQVGVPFSMIEFSMRKLEQAQQHNSEPKRAKAVQWRSHYAGISVPVLAEWKVREMPLGDTLRFSKGDIIELPGALINLARLRVSEAETYVGTVGIQNGHVAVQITGPSPSE